MREMAFLCRATDLELAQVGLRGLERLARVSDVGLVLISLLTQLGHSVFGDANISLERLEPLSIGIELALGVEDAAFQLVALQLELSDARFRRSHAVLELVLRFLEPSHFAVQSGRAFHERGI